ncbi:MFS transporter [Aureimonas leprariae]|uniref:MFS transporter n=1 Tax=Plantimonas leprariae TaxID=2615207 RepID=A0A7V7PPH4_9HYPH|nr:MFS transporter [Aureimonas leprariae]KAB0679832.1 MFS transporter [Aureimonas leprariae]
MSSIAIEERTDWADLLAGGRLPSFALICLGVWLNAADAMVAATIMPSVGADLGGYAYFGWAVAGFLIGSILAGASAGRLSEILGLAFSTGVSGGLLAVGCVLSALAPDMGTFLAGRIVQGLASGWIAGFAMVAAAVLFPPRHLARIFATMSGIWGIATILGPLVGGLSAAAGSWRAVFWLFAAQAVLFGIGAPILLRGTLHRPSGSRVPWLQLFVLALGVAAIAWADTASGAVAAVGLVALGMALLVLVLGIDARSAHRMLPHRAGDLRTICGSAYASIFALTAASMGLTVYGAAILQELRGLSPLWAGYVIGAEALAWTLAAFLVAGVSGGRGERLCIRGGACCVLLGVAMLLLFLKAAALPLVVLAASVMGAGFGLSSALTSRRVIGVVADPEKAIGSAAIVAVRQTGSAVGAAIAGVTANMVGFGAGLTTASAEAAAVWVFATALPLGLFGVWAAFRMTGRATPA